MWLAIDDIRVPSVDIIARTAEAGKWCLEHGSWEGVEMDYDLGSFTDNGITIMASAILNNKLPNVVKLITLNPVGFQEMRRLLLNNGWKRVKGNDRIFSK